MSLKPYNIGVSTEVSGKSKPTKRDILKISKSKQQADNGGLRISNRNGAKAISTTLGD